VPARSQARRDVCGDGNYAVAADSISASALVVIAAVDGKLFRCTPQQVGTARQISVAS